MSSQPAAILIRVPIFFLKPTVTENGFHKSYAWNIGPYQHQYPDEGSHIG